MSPQNTLADNGLPAIIRVITTHDNNKKAVFSSQIEDAIPWQESDGARFCLAYATNTSPVLLSNHADLETYDKYLSNQPGIMIPGGTVCRVVDMPPDMLSAMHRTVSLDYGVVLEGEVELVLDSGEAKMLKRGDIAVQRGTSHAWRNVSPNKAWARMLFVLQEAEPLIVAGEALDEDYGGIQGFKPSKAH